MLNQEPSPEQPAIESLLAGFSPKENAIDRERLMFLAGYEAAKQEYEKASTHARWANRRWKLLTFVSSAAAACLAILLVRPFPISATADRSVDQPSSAAPDAEPAEEPKNESVPGKSAVVAMSPFGETSPGWVPIGPENGCFRLRDQLLREEGFALTESKVGERVVSRPPATQRQLYLELPAEVRGAFSRVDKRSSL